jgi:hypothetical protein
MIFIPLYIMPTYKFQVENFIIKSHEIINESNTIKDKRLDKVDGNGNGCIIYGLSNMKNPDGLINMSVTHIISQQARNGNDDNITMID